MRNLSQVVRLNLKPSCLSNSSCSLSTATPSSFLKPPPSIKVKVKVLVRVTSSFSHGIRTLKHQRRPASKVQQSPTHVSVDVVPSSPSPPLPMKVENEHLMMRRIVILGAFSVGIFVLLNDQKAALAFGPGGPLVEEEFWDNVRRYALYALTVSTGAIYTILVPIFELLKSPVTAILIILILGGSFFILSQVLSAMSGVTDFSYDYNNY